MEILENKKIREKLAECSHDIWSHWMDYLFMKCETQPNGSYNIPKEFVERWERQIETKYKDLTEKEKDSDREQADKLIDALFDVGFEE
jgi:uncharacterized protein with von Willebrand factor type A (vWA) domain